MPRFRVVAAAAAAMSAALAGCSAVPDWMTPSMPDWLSSKPDGPQLQALRFETQPPGADVRTTQGQTCMTPCALTVPSETQTVTISKVGFIPQTIQVTAGEPPEHSFWESAPPPTLVPNPVQVVMQPAPPPPRVKHKPRPHRSVSRAKTEVKTTGNVFPDPASAQSAAAPPSPPPASQPATSPFPPPPATKP
jgi:hypothetical protein